MAKTSAGLLLYRLRPGLEVLLVHPGGPLWAKRDEGAWSIPKGELETDEDPRQVAAREFEEELGSPPPPAVDWLDLGEVVQAGGKRVLAWAAAGDLDVATVVSNTFEMEWPPRSGRRASFPEIDRAAWWGPTDAARLVIPAQRALLERLAERLADRADSGAGG